MVKDPTRREKSRARREPKVRLSPAAAWKTLHSDAVRQTLSAREWRRQEQVLLRQRRSLTRIVCSAQWFDAMWGSVGVEYPPGGDATKMICCSDCRRWTPVGACGGKTRCFDCYVCSLPREIVEAWPSSPGVIDMAKLAKSAKMGRAYGA